ncbi:MAG: hypothetical protein PWR00_1289 [Thermovirga sp.]|jgi:hypothetical protein|nr:hypothetical protein [Thermovirga sp.]
MRRKTVKLMAIIAGVFTALVLGIVFVNISVSDAASNKWGYITVTIYPEEVRADARWYITLGDLKQSGETVKVNTSDEVYYTIYFKDDVAGYIPPSPITVIVNRDETVAVSGTYTSSGGSSEVSVFDVTNWPLWPRKTAQYNVWEPYSFTSIGRDVVSWVTFDPLEGNETFWLSNLYIMVQTETQDFKKATIDLDNTQQFYKYIIDSGALKDFPSSLSGIRSDLIDNAVVPEYVENWMTYQSEDYPNQDFDSSWFHYDNWLNFIKGDVSGIELADSGHAPPLTMWAEDNWLTYFVDENSVPEKWVGKVYVYLPTNQGVLNCFEIDENEAANLEEGQNLTVERVWSIMPFPAFQQAIYHQVRYENDEAYSRMTILDGPVYVHDVEDSEGNWKRILVGTTGVGTKQVNKVGANWEKEGSPQPSSPPAVTDEGRVFGIYAIDVTDPLNPIPLWSVTNMYAARDEGASLNQVIVKNAPGGNISAADYSNISFMTSKPIIGFTEEDGTRTWHLLLVAIDKENKYVWINADPLTGEVISSGNFTDEEVAEELPSESTYLYNFEEWYPSRMLAAYPGNGGLPVLSDVYVYLSNGTFWKWDLNDPEKSIEEKVPQKLFTVYTNEGHTYPAPPITDFDIAYINGDTYLAATAPLDYPGIGQPHDAYGLLIVNLSYITSNGITELNTQGALGQGGDTKLRLMDYGVAMVQLQTGTGGGKNAHDFDELAASPLFANYVLYQAIYSTDGGLSRLYTLDMGYIAGLERAKGNVALPDDAYIDDTEHHFAGMTIDSKGNLIIFDEEGNIVYKIEGVLDLGGTGTGTGTTGSSGVRIVYWKTK